VRAKLALGLAESSNTEGEERGLLNVCLCQRKESSYIGAENWTLLTTIILIAHGEASERVWHALFLLPTSQVVHH
jgi:hypothetical protein